MNLNSTYTFLKRLAALSGLVAFVSLAWNFQKESAANQESVKQSWLESVVYKIIADSGNDGAKKDDILSSYITEFGTATFGLTDKDLTEGNFYKVIVSLRSKSAITLRNDNSYAAVASPREAFRNDLLSGRITYLTDAILEKVAKEPGSVDAQELKNWLETVHQAKPVEIVRSMHSVRMYLSVDQQSKLILQNTFLPFPPRFVPALQQ